MIVLMDRMKNTVHVWVKNSDVKRQENAFHYEKFATVLRIVWMDQMKMNSAVSVHRKKF